MSSAVSRQANGPVQPITAAASKATSSSSSTSTSPAVTARSLQPSTAASSTSSSVKPVKTKHRKINKVARATAQPHEAGNDSPQPSHPPPLMPCAVCCVLATPRVRIDVRHDVGHPHGGVEDGGRSARRCAERGRLHGHHQADVPRPRLHPDARARHARLQVQGLRACGVQEDPGGVQHQPGRLPAVRVRQLPVSRVHLQLQVGPVLLLHTRPPVHDQDREPGGVQVPAAHPAALLPARGQQPQHTAHQVLRQQRTITPDSSHTLAAPPLAYLPRLSLLSHARCCCVCVCVCDRACTA